MTSYSLRYRRNDRYSASCDAAARAISIAHLRRLCFFVYALGVPRARPETRFYFTLIGGENGRRLPARGLVQLADKPKRKRTGIRIEFHRVLAHR